MIHLDYRDSRPIYEQVKDSLRRLMVTGVLAPGDKLPSVRSMASQLSINPNTIQRAYRALEQEGYIVSVPGKGSFVCDGDQASRARRQELLERFEKMVKEMEQLGIPRRQLIDILKEGENQ